MVMFCLVAKAQNYPEWEKDIAVKRFCLRYLERGISSCMIELGYYNEGYQEIIIFIYNLKDYLSMINDRTALSDTVVKTLSI